MRVFFLFVALLFGCTARVTPTDAVDNFLKRGTIPPCSLFSVGLDLENGGVVDQVHPGRIVVVLPVDSAEGQDDFNIMCDPRLGRPLTYR